MYAVMILVLKKRSQLNLDVKLLLTFISVFIHSTFQMIRDADKRLRPNQKLPVKPQEGLILKIDNNLVL